MKEQSGGMKGLGIALTRRAHWFWLLQAAAVFLYLATVPGLSAVHHVDTRGYLTALRDVDLRQALLSHRTWGYPAFLELVTALTGGVEEAGYAQLGFYLVAVVVLGVVASKFLGSPWKGLAFASPLFYCPLVPHFARTLRPELPAAAWVTLTFAGLLGVLLEPRRWWSWAALTLSLAFTYHTRPSYLFLLAWVPIAGLLLGHSFGSLGDWRSGRRLLLGFGLACGVPFLLWCTLRLVVVGQFGLVSFGSINWIGITGSLLSREMMPELPAAERPLARQILRQKEELGLSPAYDFERLRHEYNRVVFDCALAAIRRDPERPKQDPRAQWVYANRKFTAFSLAIVQARPGLYLRWLTDASAFTIWRLLRSPWMLIPALAAALSGFVAWRKKRRPQPTTRALALATLLYGLLSLGLVLAVETPLDRYLFAGVLFVPGALLCLAVEVFFGERAA